MVSTVSRATLRILATSRACRGEGRGKEGVQEGVGEAGVERDMRPAYIYHGATHGVHICKRTRTQPWVTHTYTAIHTHKRPANHIRTQGLGTGHGTSNPACVSTTTI